jgi:hypothetical protein
VDNDWNLDAVNDADLVDDRGVVSSDDHREAFVELEDADWVFVCVADVSSLTPCLRALAAMISCAPTTTSYLVVGDPSRSRAQYQSGRVRPTIRYGSRGHSKRRRHGETQNVLP